MRVRGGAQTFGADRFKKSWRKTGLRPAALRHSNDCSIARRLVFTRHCRSYLRDMAIRTARWRQIQELLELIRQYGARKDVAGAIAKSRRRARFRRRLHCQHPAPAAIRRPSAASAPAARPAADGNPPPTPFLLPGIRRLHSRIRKGVAMTPSNRNCSN